VNFAIEYTFSPVYHSTKDSVSYMNFDYMKEVVKGGAATLYYLKYMPATVSSISLQDRGDSSVIVKWQNLLVLMLQVIKFIIEMKMIVQKIIL